MPKEQHDNYFAKPNEIPIQKDPFSIGKNRGKEEETEGQISPENRQLNTTIGSPNLVPMIRKHASETGSIPLDQKLSEKTKMENWKNLEKEFKNKFNALKKGNKSLTVTTMKGDTGSHYLVSKGNSSVCSVIMGKKGIMLIAGPEEKSFRFSDKKDFFNSFDGLCSK